MLVNRAGKHLPLRHLPQPESIQMILDETGNSEVFDAESLCAIAVIYFEE